METLNDLYSTSVKRSGYNNKSNKKRKWREIEAILDQRSLSNELRQIDEFCQLGLSENELN